VNLKFYVFTERPISVIIGVVAAVLIVIILLLLAAVFYFRAKQGKYILLFFANLTQRVMRVAVITLCPCFWSSIDFYISGKLSFTFRSFLLS
jgi:hypothetical protein